MMQYTGVEKVFILKKSFKDSVTTMVQGKMKCCTK